MNLTIKMMRNPEPTSEIILHPDRPAREQIEVAVANIKLRPCPDHPHELLAFDYVSTLKMALRDPQVESAWFRAVFNRCSSCPHNQQNDIKALNCAVERNRGFRELDQTDVDGKRLPWEFESVKLSPDESPSAALSKWVEQVKHRGMRCWNHDLTFLKAVPLEARSLSLNPTFATCPACVLESIGLTPDEARASFTNFVCDPSVLEEHLKVSRDYANNPKGVLLMLGGPGTGKTHLGTSILRGQIGRGPIEPVFFKVRHLLDRYWQSIRPVPFDTPQPESPLERCQWARLLMLDELATLPTHFDAEGFLLDLFEQRLGNYRPTIITSNLTRAELEAAIGTRLFDRLRRATAAMLEFGFESKRSKLNADYLSKAR